MLGQLILVLEAIQTFSELENQDNGLTVEMVEVMLRDIIGTGRLRPMIEYVGRYCDVIDSQEDKERIAREIERITT